MRLPRSILVATDFSENAAQALDYAVALAARLGATVHAVNAITPVVLSSSMYADALLPSLIEGNEAALDALVAARRDKATLGTTTLEIGDPRDIINATARSVAADLIVLGTRGRGGIARALLGSVAESVARTAPCPVLLIRREQAA
jgi:nucleotide-binding universal stress UspA family protein